MDYENCAIKNVHNDFFMDFENCVIQNFHGGFPMYFKNGVRQNFHGGFLMDFGNFVIHHTSLTHAVSIILRAFPALFYSTNTNPKPQHRPITCKVH